MATCKCESCGTAIRVTDYSNINCACGWNPARPRAARTQPKPERAPRRAQRDLNGEFFDIQLAAAGLAVGLVREYRFLKDRRYRFDGAYPALRIAIEIDGGNWTNGGHNTGSGHLRDCRKGNLAVINGWKLLRFVTNDIDDGTALRQVEEALAAARGGGEND